MPDASPTPLTRRRRDVKHGRITRHLLEDEFLIAGRKRTALLYRPPTSEPSPLLVALDGQDYRPRAKLVNIVDNLIAQERIRPVAMALIYHGGQARAIEYACSEAHLGVLLHLLLPLAEKELSLLDVRDQPGVHGIMGASMGGLMALFAGLRAPQVFGRVLSQSGSFTVGEHDTVALDLVRHGPVRPLKIWMDAGRYEWLSGPNRRMRSLLAERGYDVTYREYSGGHNYTSWRNDLWRGLEALYGAQ
jgi:enterochelin esterase family protein